MIITTYLYCGNRISNEYDYNWGDSQHHYQCSYSNCFPICRFFKSFIHVVAVKYNKHSSTFKLC